MSWFLKNLYIDEWEWGRNYWHGYVHGQSIMCTRLSMGKRSVPAVITSDLSLKTPNYKHSGPVFELIMVSTPLFTLSTSRTFQPDTLWCGLAGQPSIRWLQESSVIVPLTAGIDWPKRFQCQCKAVYKLLKMRIAWTTSSTSLRWIIQIQTSKALRLRNICEKNRISSWMKSRENVQDLRWNLPFDQFDAFACIQ